MKRPSAFPRTNDTKKALLLFGFLFTPLLAETPGSAGRTLPLDIQIEILRVGGDGTQVLGMEEARILAGKGGALVVKELSLSAPGGKKGVEKLSLRAEIRALSLLEGSLIIGLRSRVNVLATSGVPLARSEIRRDVSAEVSEGASELLEVYESAALASKLILNIRWFRAPADAIEDVRRTPIPLTLRVYEVGESSTLRSENQLLAVVGGAATATFTRSVTLDEEKGNGKRVRQERMEISLAPQYQVGRTLSLILEAAGEVFSRSPSAELSHPISVREELFLDPRLPASVEFEITSGDREREGWDRIHYRLEVTALF
jgi:hypothetical protein